MNRHNILVVIGIATLAVGAIAGTGALTQVTADRTANVQVDGDSDAAVGLSPAGQIAQNVSSSNALSLELSTLNDDALTFTEAFTVTNNIGEDVGVQITVENSPSWIEVRDDSNASVSSYQTITTGSDKTYGLLIDTADASFSDDTDVTIVVEADTSQS